MCRGSIQTRAQLAEKELILLQKEQELLEKEESVMVLKEQVRGAIIEWLYGRVCARATNIHKQRDCPVNFHCSIAKLAEPGYDGAQSHKHHFFSRQVANNGVCLKGTVGRVPFTYETRGRQGCCI